VIFDVADEAETRLAGSDLATQLRPGDVVLFSGDLGAGKTTMIRGILEGLGHVGPVRSPTFNLVQIFPTHPPVMHADLYRVSGYQGIGIEDYLESHVCLIEWPDRAEGLVPEEQCWHIQIDFLPTGRRIRIREPHSSR
jgi:tRNA threonylcarbamoyladenosine biosynthesis protein TsaE